ncbi:MAG: hypothetical protein KY462_09035 [Actinobacteria bacterium]|nr:hypothetical protein [Actinomycetota bacterium]
MRRVHRMLTVWPVTVGVLVLTALPAFAPHVAQLHADPTRVEPGAQVRVWGPRGYAPESTVEIRFGAPDGPVLGTFETDSQFYAAFTPGTVTIPQDVEPGVYTLFATQQLNEDTAYIRGVPAKTVIRVSAPGVAAPVADAPLFEEGFGRFPLEPRPAGVAVQDQTVGWWPLAAIAVGVAALAVGAGMLAGRLARRRSEAAPQASAE